MSSTRIHQNLVLESDGFESNDELWSQTLFGVSFEDGSEEQQKTVKMISQTDEPTVEDTSEVVDEAIAVPTPDTPDKPDTPGTDSDSDNDTGSDSDNE